MQKRRTRAAMAKEKGLEPLAELLLELSATDPNELAENSLMQKKK